MTTYLFLAAVFLGWAAAAQDNPEATWSVFHGDNLGRARSETIPYMFDQLGAKEAWQYDTRANGLDRVAGRNGIVFDIEGNLYWRTSISGGEAALASVDPTGVLRWASPRDLGGYDSTSPIVGEDAVYVVTVGNLDPGKSGIRAYDKANGDLIWSTPVPGNTVEGPGLTPVLHEGHLYGTGNPSGGTIPLWCVNAATGGIEWQTDVFYDVVDGGGNPINPAGHILFIPDAFGPALHGFYFNVDPINESNPWAVWAYTAGPSGGSWTWRQTGGKVARSHLVYSETTGYIYAATWRDYGGTCYVYEPETGARIGSGNNPQNSGHGFYDVVALDFDDETLIAGGFDARVYRYKVEISTTDTRTNELPDGEGMLRGLALEMEPTAAGTEHGPLYYDNLIVREDSAAVYESGGFEALLPGSILGQDDWVEDTDQGYDPVQVIDDPTGEGMGQVLEFDPPGTGGGWQGIARSFAAELGQDGDETITIEWDQWRGDLDDNFWYADDPDFSRWWAMQWDQNGSAFARNYNAPMPLSTGVWQHLTYTLDLAAGTSTVSTPLDGPVTNVVSELVYQAPEWYGEYRSFGGLYRMENGHSVLVTGSRGPEDLGYGARVVAFDVTAGGMLWFYDSGVVADHYTLRGGPIIGPDGKIYYFSGPSGVLFAVEPGDVGFRITDIERRLDPAGPAVEPDIELTWNSVVEPGLYRVERASAAGADNWADISGTISGTAYTDDSPPLGAGKAIYRVRHDPFGVIAIFFDDFEGDDTWTTGGAGDNWERGTPADHTTTGGAPSAAYSGANCWATGLAADHLPDAVAYLESPAIDLTGAGSATLVFRGWRSLEDGIDEVYVQLYEDGGGLLDEITPAITGEFPSWQELTVDLGTSGAGKIVRIRFELRSDDSLEFPGLYIDDVLVTAP